MPPLQPGRLSGYRSPGSEVRADAGQPHAARSGGNGAVGGYHPSQSVKPLESPGRSVTRVAVQYIQHAQFKAAQQKKQQAAQAAKAAKAKKTAQPKNQAPAAPSGSSTASTGSVPGPAYGGAAYNGGGGNLAYSMSTSTGNMSRGLPGPSSPGVRVTSKPPTTMRQSQAGRRRRAENFKASHAGPKILQGTAEDVTPAGRPRLTDEEIARQVKNKRTSARWRDSAAGMRL